jgi:transcriptional regulator with XRE-family HTH domain
MQYFFNFFSKRVLFMSKSAEIFKKLRFKLRQTQPELAEALGVSLPTIQGIEYGKREPSAKIMSRVNELMAKNGFTSDSLMREPEPAAEVPAGALSIILSQQETLLAQAEAIKAALRDGESKTDAIKTMADSNAKLVDNNTKLVDNTIKVAEDINGQMSFLRQLLESKR